MDKLYQICFHSLKSIIFHDFMDFIKNSLLTCLIFLVASGFSPDCYAQDSLKKWSIGLNFHASSEMVYLDTEGYHGINFSVERNILKYFSLGLSGTSFKPDYILSYDYDPRKEEKYRRKTESIALFLIGDIVQVSRFNFYGKTGIDYRIESRQGSYTIYEIPPTDGARIIIETGQINSTNKNTGFIFGIGLEVKYKAIFFIERSISYFKPVDFIHVITGIKIPL